MKEDERRDFGREKKRREKLRERALERTKVIKKRGNPQGESPLFSKAG